WFAAGQLHSGQRIRCFIGGHRFQTTMPRATATSGMVWFGKAGKGSIQISRRAGGEAQIECGNVSTAARVPVLPYVIGQNGVALIRGTNHRSQLRRVLGKPTSSKGCSTIWGRIGFRAAFAGSCTNDPTLAKATVTSTRWSTLLGTHVGDELAKMR